MVCRWLNLDTESPQIKSAQKGVADCPFDMLSQDMMSFACMQFYSWSSKAFWHREKVKKDAARWGIYSSLPFWYMENFNQSLAPPVDSGRIYEEPCVQRQDSIQPRHVLADYSLAKVVKRGFTAEVIQARRAHHTRDVILNTFSCKEHLTKSLTIWLLIGDANTGQLQIHPDISFFPLAILSLKISWQVQNFLTSRQYSGKCP